MMRSMMHALHACMHAPCACRYITVDEEAGRALFFVFVESSSNPLSDPLVLWLNGGPGCSSLGGGFLSELGPWFPQPGGRALQPNPHAWHQAASMLFLETPAFVGFSYSNLSSDRFSSEGWTGDGTQWVRRGGARLLSPLPPPLPPGDALTAEDSHRFLLGFLERFPAYRHRDLFLAGESYAGHYIPKLSQSILRVRVQ